MGGREIFFSSFLALFSPREKPKGGEKSWHRRQIGEGREMQIEITPDSVSPLPIILSIRSSNVVKMEHKSSMSGGFFRLRLIDHRIWWIVRPHSASRRKYWHYAPNSFNISLIHLTLEDAIIRKPISAPDCVLPKQKKAWPGRVQHSLVGGKCDHWIMIEWNFAFALNSNFKYIIILKLLRQTSVASFRSRGLTVTMQRSCLPSAP